MNQLWSKWKVSQAMIVCVFQECEMLFPNSSRISRDNLEGFLKPADSNWRISDVTQIFFFQDN